MTQPTLDLGLPEPGPGPVEQAAHASVKAAVEAEVLEATDAGMAALVVTLGRTVDQASSRGNIRGVALVAKELRESAARLRLDPTARGEAAGDAFADLLRDLGQTSGGPTVGHPSQP